MSYGINDFDQSHTPGGGTTDPFYSTSTASVGYEFGQFDYTDQEYNTSQSGGQQPNIMTPQMFTPPQVGSYDTDPFSGMPGQRSTDPYADEPPLLEELGINFDQIVQKTYAVMNPFRKPDPTILQDSDLAGPLVLCLAFGSFLLVSGKVHFGYIYGFGVLGCLAIYMLLNLMSSDLSLSIACTVSVLGYCLLPMVVLSGLSIIISLKALIGTISVVLAISWCSWSASKLFVIALNLHNQQALIAYPCALLYGVFALLTVF
ncbi:protein YIPF5 homolog [Oppia nitens]|uniref:protein YIPF5 homolog n=1 Tax=Oppia nitens TaxID=1686743 RepID=UPI0023D9A08D|nr:protein YIPF5 homolog [Oppia nitens]